MPEKIIIDASVVLKWIPGEKETEVTQARKTYKLLKEKIIQVIAPSFLLLEVSNILFKKRKARVEIVSRAIQRLRACGIQYQDFRIDVVNEVIKLMSKYNITAYDAIYLSLAKTHKAKLLTFDKELLKIRDLTIGIEEMLKNILVNKSISYGK
ncbi:hypothetical protein COV53_03045 [Candidatus Gottesmanbacteria bacterium CG11_big_fil_rev_8_21_14_0_20_37_11]|uniref:PIN domain-containing protein n=3 Tax=Candidatus Gottesmaniibacteriota TaxID=1752720 RepID=A0A2M7RQ09_9BACT|nr:MAG: hypothetical protein AUJ73_00715 [Candidatus Gottesmanbacteria bacterium CG1_02_37_22]PIP33238.1 MAG: hypothetical protein COX23_00470 [Candidatus Gottesmanbacteria bacterium CG23_combo_of_CG06-09_8_20_14_all_37_19]PIR08427.1 MAG: hypothetical protein COV53_03045 [Candidatus Gottesmanbacteria bacterium CG11_big_fil_rev_8_21_14_0_20_37_11]PIZ02407.1 MAG: hypothetical protein COY59_04990 [Candidatus Gottesmanbacteria bacterium CG_4_10_14_0_8_um_filter_37_24]